MLLKLREIAALSLALTIVTANPLPKGSDSEDDATSSAFGLDYDYFEGVNAKERISIIQQAEQDATDLANSALNAINNKRILRLYFPTDTDSKKSVRDVYTRIANGEHFDEIRVLNGVEKSRGCDRGNILAYTTPVKLPDFGYGTMTFCPMVWLNQGEYITSSLADVLSECRAKKPKKMVQDMFNWGGLVLHELTHFSPIGLGHDTRVNGIIDVRGSESYGISAARTLGGRKDENKISRIANKAADKVKSIGQSRGKNSNNALLNADNYNWFAVHAYLEENCGVQLK